MSRERADQLNTAALMDKLQEMNQRVYEVEKKVADMHAALVTAMTKLNQAEHMLTMYKAEKVGTGPTEV